VDCWNIYCVTRSLGLKRVLTNYVQFSIKLQTESTYFRALGLGKPNKVGLQTLCSDTVFQDLRSYSLIGIKWRSGATCQPPLQRGRRSICAKFEVPSAVFPRIHFIWDMMLFCWVIGSRHSEWMWRPSLQGSRNPRELFLVFLTLLEKCFVLVRNVGNY